MKKYFKYCESTDGGMHSFDVTSKDCLSSLYGWMHSLCKVDDNDLIKFMESAKIGDYHEHRLGILFCINAPTGEKKETMEKEYVFKVITFEAGQRKPYGDSFYHYEVTSDRPSEEVKDFCMNVLRKSYPRDKMPHPFAGELIEFKNLTNLNEGRKFLDKRRADTYRYKMKTMYTG